MFPGKKNSVESEDEGHLEVTDFNINALACFLTESLGTMLVTSIFSF
jgi:hypothetical protein